MYLNIQTPQAANVGGNFQLGHSVLDGMTWIVSLMAHHITSDCLSPLSATNKQWNICIVYTLFPKFFPITITSSHPSPTTTHPSTIRTTTTTATTHCIFTTCPSTRTTTRTRPGDDNKKGCYFLLISLLIAKLQINNKCPMMMTCQGHAISQCILSHSTFYY